MRWFPWVAVLWVVTCLVGGSATAQDVPTVGMVYNTSERASLVFACRDKSQTEIECDFSGVRVRKVAKPDDLREALDAAIKDFRSVGLRFSSGECDTYRKLLAVIQGRETSPDPEKAKKFVADMSAIEKRDMIELVTAMIALCDTPSERQVRDLFRLEQSKKERSCYVSEIRRFTQTFRRTSWDAPWTATAAPSGACGIVDLGRFEQEKRFGLPVWKYYSRNVITNPNAALGFGTDKTCATLDQLEHLWDWQGPMHFAGCDYIEFVP